MYIAKTHHKNSHEHGSYSGERPLANEMNCPCETDFFFLCSPRCGLLGASRFLIAALVARSKYHWSKMYILTVLFPATALAYVAFSRLRCTFEMCTRLAEGCARLFLCLAASAQAWAAILFKVHARAHPGGHDSSIKRVARLCTDLHWHMPPHGSAPWTSLANFSFQDWLQWAIGQIFVSPDYVESFVPTNEAALTKGHHVYSVPEKLGATNVILDWLLCYNMLSKYNTGLNTLKPSSSKWPRPWEKGTQRDCGSTEWPLWTVLNAA